VDKDTRDFLRFLDMHDRRPQALCWLQKELAAHEKRLIVKWRRQHAHPMLDTLVGGTARQETGLTEAEAMLKANALADITDTLTVKRHTRRAERDAAFQRLVNLCGQAEAVRLVKSAAGMTTD
jgi:hypothetical protein